MKKLYKLLIAVCAIVLMLPALSVKALDSQAILKEIMQTSSEIKQAEMTGWISATIEQDGQKSDIGMVTLDSAIDLEGLQVHVDSTIKSMFLGQNDIATEVYVKDGVVYTKVAGIQGEEQWEKANIDQTVPMNYAQTIQSNLLTDDRLLKYYDVIETDNEYIVSVKKDINSQELWKDLESVMDLQVVKQQMIEQMKSSGSSDDDIAQAESMYDRVFSSEMLQIILSENPEIFATYDKETYQPIKSEITLQLPLHELAKYFLGADASEDMVKSLPSNVIFKGEFHYKSINTPMEITIPAEALNAPEALELTSSSEE